MKKKALLFNLATSQKQAERHKSWTSHFKLLRAGKPINSISIQKRVL